MTQRLVSVWQPFFLGAPDQRAALDAANELAELGYSRIWFSAGFDETFPARFGELLAGTRRIGVASGIATIWHTSPAEVAAFRVLAALGPRMLELARDRSAGAHPYFTTAEHTAEARAALGPDRLLAPEVAVVVEPDPARARAIARQYTTGYLTLPNYTNNLRRFGWTDDDLAGGGSDRLVDAVIPWGTPEQIAARLDEHYRAGADEVAVQVLNGGDVTSFPAEEFRALAAVLI